MAVPECRINQTPNHRAEIARKHFQEARALAEAFLDELFVITKMKGIPPGIEVIDIIQPADATKDIGVPHLWQLTYRNGDGEVCTTSLREYGGKESVDAFVSFEMRDSTTPIEWNTYGERTITES